MAFTKITAAGIETSGSLTFSGATIPTGPVLIGSGTSTGTASQPLQVTGGAYVSGSIGIGTTRPTSKLHVQGSAYVSGITTLTRLIVNPIGGGTTFTENLVVEGSARVTGILSIGTGTITLDPNDNAIVLADIKIRRDHSTGDIRFLNTSGNLSNIIANTVVVGSGNSAVNISNVNGSVVFTDSNNTDIYSLDRDNASHNGNVYYGGISTASQFSTGASGTGINIDTNTISGPSILYIDPSAVGDNTGAVRIKGDLYVDGTTTTIDSTTLSVDDKNIELGSVASPTDVTADGGGITLKGATDKTFNWVSSTAAWTSSEDLNLATGKVYEIAGTTVLSSTQVLGKSMPSGTVIGTTDTQTLTNKTIAAGSNTISGLTNSNLSGTAAITNANLANSTISGVALGSNLNTITFNSGGTGAASGTTFNGSTAQTISYNTLGASPLAGSSSLVTTGTVTSGTWSGSFGAVSGANLTGLTAGNLSGTIPSGVLGNSTLYVGTTAIILNRASASQSLTGINIDGSSGSCTGNAATATNLQTSRTINGTGFNGSASIDTTEWFHSDRDFPNGTLITTNINYAVSSGDPFVLEIRGNSYGNIIPLDLLYQGYIYSDTIINHGGLANGFSISGLVAINVGGNLCFWFPTQGYWNGYNVKVYTAYATRATNRVTSITGTTKPTSTKEVALSANIRQSLHSGNYNSYAPTLTGTGASGSWGISVTGTSSNITAYTINQSVGTGNGPTFADVYVSGWFRNNASGNGLYNQATGMHWYSDSANYLNMGAGQTSHGIRFRDNHAGTIRGYLYYNNSSEKGFLNSAGSWSVRVDDSHNTQIYGYLTVGGSTSSDIYMTDSDEGTRRIHCNSNRVGFLNQDANWGSYCSDNGDWTTDYISYAGASMRTPIFYDSNDTTYYLDPNSTGDSALRIRGGALHGPNPTWGAYLLVGGDGRQNYTNNTTTASICTSNGNLHIDAASGYETYINYYDGSNIYFGNGANGNVAQITSDGTFRSPVFYDYNNTGYYTDPASTSNLNSVSMQGGNVYGVMYFHANRNTTSDSPPLQAYSSNGSGAIMSFHRGGYYAVNFGLDSDNVIRIGGWSASANRWVLDMSGNMTAAGNVTAYSDIRLKDNIELIKNAVEKVGQLNGVTFTRNDQEDKTRRHTGVIAQEVEKVLPEVVSEDNLGIKNVAYGNMVGLLIEAIKEQQNDINNLKQQIKDLKTL